jgi:hypothetical protein
MKIRVSKKLSVLVGTILLAAGGVLTGELELTKAIISLVPAICWYLGGQSLIDLVKVGSETPAPARLSVDSSWVPAEKSRADLQRMVDDAVSRQMVGSGIAPG